MATYSNAPTESIVRFSNKESAFNSTTYISTLVTVGTNEMYELLQLHAVAQDGNINHYYLHGDYSGIVDEPGSAAQGISGYSWYATFVQADGTTSPFTEEGTADAEHLRYPVNLGDLDYSIAKNESPVDQFSLFVNNFGPKRLIFRQGAVIKLEFNLTGFTPSNEEFIDSDIWFKKTVFNP
tara:strand:+ start:1358 stop:1900 length:543 start_codon:yes stop_codon:yes gene_type:complete